MKMRNLKKKTRPSSSAVPLVWRDQKFGWLEEFDSNQLFSSKALQVSMKY